MVVSLSLPHQRQIVEGRFPPPWSRMTLPQFRQEYLAADGSPSVRQPRLQQASGVAVSILMSVMLKLQFLQPCKPHFHVFNFGSGRCSIQNTRRSADAARRRGVGVLEPSTGARADKRERRPFQCGVNVAGENL